MREEFEFAWQVSRSDDEGGIGGKPTRSKIDSDRYAGDAAQFAWMWWQRSRAALCVELPKQYSTDSIGSAYCVDAVIDSLDSAGVQYK